MRKTLFLLPVVLLLCHTSHAWAGSVITASLPAGTAIVNIDAQQDGTANYNGDQSLFYSPFSTQGAASLLTLPVTAGTYTFTIIDPADAAVQFPLLTAAQLGTLYTAWTYNSPWITDYMVFDISAATNPNIPQLFDGSPDPTSFGDAQSAYNDAVANGYANEIRAGPTGRDGTVFTTTYTVAADTTLVFAVPDNGLYDNSGGVSVVVHAVTGVVAGPGDVRLSAATTTVTEAAGSVTLSVNRTGGSAGAVSVNYTTADDTAFAGTDYQAVSGTLSWADGDATPKTITVPIINRSLTAGSTLFLVNLSSPAGGATLGAPIQESVTILDIPSTADLQSVSLLSPPSGVTLTQGQPVVLQADVEALSGTLANVEFFAVDSSGNSTDLGGTSSARGQVTWTPTAADTYTLQVVATDTSGNTQQATSTVTVAAAANVTATPQVSLDGSLDGITVPLNTAVPVVAQAVDSAGNALQNVQFYLDGVPVSSAPVSAIRKESARSTDATSAGTLYLANVVASKLQQILTVVGTTVDGISSVSTAATLYAKADAGTPPAASISNLASGASVPTNAGQSVSVSATSGSQAIAKVQLVVDNQSVGTVTAAPFAFSLPALSAGAHVLSIVATDINSLSSVSAPVIVTAEQTPATPAFFTGETALSNGVYYLAFSNGNYFGYYSFLTDPAYIYHFDLGFEYVFDAADGKSGVYFYDFASSTFFYTSPVFPFPYLYDFTLNSVLYYYPDPSNAGHYNTDGVRYFYDFNTGTIISK